MAKAEKNEQMQNGRIHNLYSTKQRKSYAYNGKRLSPKQLAELTTYDGIITGADCKMFYATPNQVGFEFSINVAMLDGSAVRTSRISAEEMAPLMRKAKSTSLVELVGFPVTLHVEDKTDNCKAISYR